jgi:hypothetical protein
MIEMNNKETLLLTTDKVSPFGNNVVANSEIPAYFLEQSRKFPISLTFLLASLL